MLNKKPIAVLAAGATLASGLAFAAPALAEDPGNQVNPAPQAQNDVQDLGKVSFKFTFGSGSAAKTLTTRAITVYSKDGKYGFDKSDINYGADSIAYSFLSEHMTKDGKVNFGTKESPDLQEIKGVAFPTTISKGENVVAVADHAASNPTEVSEEELQKQANEQFKELWQPVGGGNYYPLVAVMSDGQAQTPAETPADGTMYRLYNPWTGEHLFTINPQEKDNCVAAGWTFEGTVGKALLEKGDPVYRLLNPTTGEHHYTMDENEVKACVANGWKDEGVVFYSAKKDDKGAIAMVSLYNPYHEAFYHHYTSDEGEIQARVADGWKNEGPKFYLVK